MIDRTRSVTWKAGDNAAAALTAISPAAQARPSMVPEEYHYNPLGTVHGGVIATLLDLSMADAVDLALPAGSHAVRLELKVNYLRGLTKASGRVSGNAVVVQAGRRVAAAIAQVVDANGRIFATGSATYLVTDRPAGIAGPAGEYHFAWSDPAGLAAAGMGMPGIDFLYAMQRQTLPSPPALMLLGITTDAAVPGRVAMTMSQGGHLLDATGHLHGGMIATLLDSVMGCAVHSTLPLGRGYTTLEIRVSFIRPVTPADGGVRSVGTVLHAGNQVASVEARATDAAGTLVATASSTCLVFDVRA